MKEETFTSGSLLEWYKALAVQQSNELKQRDETIKDLKQEIANHTAVNSLLLDSSEEAKLANHIHELQSVLQNKDETIKELKEALKEMVKITEYYVIPTNDFISLEKISSSIDKARKLISNK